MMKSKQMKLSFPLPLHVMIDGPVEEDEVELLLESVVHSSRYNRTIGTLFNHLTNNPESAKVIIKHDEVINVLIQQLTLSSDAIKPTIQTLSILSINHPNILLRNGCIDKLTQLVVDGIDYSTYLSTLDCFFNLVSTKNPNYILPLIDSGVLSVILNGISNMDGEFEERDLCSEMLLICVSIDEVCLALTYSTPSLHDFLHQLSLVYQQVLIEMSCHVLLLRLCECIDNLSSNNIINTLIKSSYQELLQ
ncbi:Uncharacterized protein QTN25_006976 [Entamoeba marina]